MLENDKSLHKFLISTPARIVGNYRSGDVSIDISFPEDDSMLNYQDSPHSRTFLIVTISVPPVTYPEVIFGVNQSFHGEIFSSLLSLVYGKEFKYHGLLESYGLYKLPNMNNEANSLYYLPFFNSSPRKDLEIPLNLEKFGLIEPLIINNNASVTDEFSQKIIATGKFYNRAIRMLPREPELAYLDLITCGEMISSFYDDDFTEEELYDEKLMKSLEQIKTLENGESIAKDIKNRLYQVKRKFTAALLKNLNDEFFSKTETINNVGRIHKVAAEKLIKKGYDLRSLYVHTGADFSEFIIPRKGINNEIQVFTPAHETDKKLANVISDSPSFLGLERIIRFSLLSLINANGVPIDSRLKNT
ncbi:MAG: hypothetical protein ABS939_00410 [Psychrobacillus sp.]